VAVGSHQPSVRKLDSQLVGRAVVVVEDVRTALSEAGDVILAIAEGQLRDDELIPMARAAYTAHPGSSPNLEPSW
jgi:ornithine cyclodeaminase/alanine dehydrogenase-like protein (mu-crystallin family)